MSGYTYDLLPDGGDLQSTDLVCIQRDGSLAYKLTGLDFNPMTTLGDMSVGGVDGKVTRLSGNMTIAPLYLKSTGTGSAATLPAWTQISAADLASGASFPAIGANALLVTNPTTSLLDNLADTLVDIHNAGSGTVSTVSVVTANGFAGTVANPTTTPAITLTTTVTGLIKGNGTNISAATSGVDYSLGTAGLGTGILKSTTGTGVFSIAVAGDFPVLNQDTTGNAATATTATTATSALASSAIAGGVQNNILYQTATGVTSFIAPVNNAVLVSSASGEPFMSTNLPAVGSGDTMVMDPSTSFTNDLNSTLSNLYSEGVWTPTDASGAGLTLTNLGSAYVKIGNQITLSFTVSFPVNTDGTNIFISGLPFPIATTGYGSSITTNASLNGYVAVVGGPNPGVSLISNGSSIAINSDLSNQQWSATITYVTA